MLKGGSEGVSARSGETHRAAVRRDLPGDPSTRHQWTPNDITDTVYLACGTDYAAVCVGSTWNGLTGGRTHPGATSGCPGL